VADIDFFISYTNQDEAWAWWVAEVLESAGYSTFLFGRDVRPGGDFVSTIDQALRSTNRTIALLSENYLNSRFGEAEWLYVFSKDPTGEQGILVPVRIAPVRPLGLLASRTYIDLVGLDEAAATRRLLAAISKTSGSRIRHVEFPGSSQGEQTDARTQPAPGQVARAIEGGKGKVFVSYSHRDRRWVNRLLVHLKPLERAGYLDVWEDSRITPGRAWKDEIDKALKSAQIAVLLISADFLASDFIADNEVPNLLMSARDRGTIIMPVIVSPSRFEQTESLSQFQAVNPPDMPLTKLPNYRRELFLVGLASAIEDALASFRNELGP
jgi:TIR domain